MVHAPELWLTVALSWSERTMIRSARSEQRSRGALPEEPVYHGDETSRPLSVPLPSLCRAPGEPAAAERRAAGLLTGRPAHAGAGMGSCAERGFFPVLRPRVRVHEPRSPIVRGRAVRPSRRLPTSKLRNDR